MRKRVKLSYTAQTGWHVDLPTYQMIPGTCLPIIAGKTTPDGVLPTANPADPALNALTVQIECPDDYADPTTQKINPSQVRRKYKGNPKWDRPDWIPPD